MPVLENLGASLYLDDTDGKNIYSRPPSLSLSPSLLPSPSPSAATYGVTSGLLYVDHSHDGVSPRSFLGMKAEQDLSQHKVRLGTLPATAGRWLSCARQKLWWMSPDVSSLPPYTLYIRTDI